MCETVLGNKVLPSFLASFHVGVTNTDYYAVNILCRTPIYRSAGRTRPVVLFPYDMSTILSCSVQNAPSVKGEVKDTTDPPQVGDVSGESVLLLTAAPCLISSCD